MHIIENGTFSLLLTGDKICKMLDDKLENYITEYGKTCTQAINIIPTHLT